MRSIQSRTSRLSMMASSAPAPLAGEDWDEGTQGLAAFGNELVEGNAIGMQQRLHLFGIDQRDDNIPDFRVDLSKDP